MSFRMPPAPTEHSPQEVIEAIGGRIRMARHLSGLKQADLAALVGCSYQQFQKYEHGRNRITADRLLLIARHTGQKPEFFFEDLRFDPDQSDNDSVRSKSIIEFVEEFSKLDANQRKSIMGVMKGMTKEQ